MHLFYCPICFSLPKYYLVIEINVENTDMMKNDYKQFLILSFLYIANMLKYTFNSYYSPVNECFKILLQMHWM